MLNKKYRYFGTASAKTDDFMNFIPARISLLIIPAAAAMCRKNWKNSYKTAIRDRRKSPSVNSGIPEAAFAGTLGVRLGGNNYYNGIISIKPEIGDNIRPLDKEDIVLALKLTYASSLIFLFFCILIFLLILLLLYFLTKWL
ncbi:MAG: cobalamin biosynthesis protein [Candidatus Humimicrobiaceae bacterium]